MVLVHHDDAVREYDTDSTMRVFSDALMALAKQRKWWVASMKNDWNRLFAWQPERPGASGRMVRAEEPRATSADGPWRASARAAQPRSRCSSCLTHSLSSDHVVGMHVPLT